MSEVPPPGRTLGVDPGTKRVGLAVCDELGLSVRPLETVSQRDFDARVARVCEVAQEQDVVRLVVGMPRNMDGTRHASAGRVRAFALTCRKRSGLELEFQDERLTTVEAERLLRAAGKSRRRVQDEIDAAAAAVLLRDWLDERRRAADFHPDTPPAH